MVIGSGLLASKFLEQKDEFENQIIFASGVSNSNEIDESKYHREIELVSKILDENPDLTFIYFSCVLADVTKNRYYLHKLEIETLIKECTNKYVIFRVPQIVGNGGNKNNLFNVFKSSANNDVDMVIYTDVERSIIDVDDLVEIVKKCMWVVNQTINISNIEKISAHDLYKKIAWHLNKIPTIMLKESKSNNWSVENSEIIDYVIDYLGIQREGYTDNVIKKYINNGNTNGLL
jgi:nucleoside-diphosphate-sugar epimerase